MIPSRKKKIFDKGLVNDVTKIHDVTKIDDVIIQTIEFDILLNNLNNPIPDVI